MQEVANRRGVLQSRGDDASEDPAPRDRAGATAGFARNVVLLARMPARRTRFFNAEAVFFVAA